MELRGKGKFEGRWAVRREGGAVEMHVMEHNLPEVSLPTSQFVKWLKHIFPADVQGCCSCQFRVYIIVSMSNCQLHGCCLKQIKSTVD